MLQSVLFSMVVVFAGWFGWRGFSRVRRNILLGKAEKITGPTADRWRNVALVALGQRKMFKLTTAAVLHLFIYAAFVITQVELLEIFVDGFFGTHRFFGHFMGAFYSFIINFIEILSLLAFVATIAFLYRRNILKLVRFQKPELRGWPSRDANLILLGEITLIIGIFSMNGADQFLQKLGDPHFQHGCHFAVSGWFGPAFLGGISENGLLILERFGWWLHALTVFAFIVYLPYSKHLHIILAFPATFFARLSPKGELRNMPEIQKEVRLMMGLDQPDPNETTPAELPEFGANDIFSLGWTQLLQAYSCTECGRCTASCPANLTGKKLSPRKIMMDVRDRMEEVGQQIDLKLQPKTGYSDGKTLFDRISPEEIHACTTCNACVEACPILLNPLDIIVELRRHEILTQSAGPGEWLPLFNAIENSGAAWQMPVEREAWRQTT